MKRKISLADASLKTLRQLKVDTLGSLRAISDRIKDERRSMTAAERGEFDELQQYLQHEVSPALEAKELQLEAERQYGTTGQHIDPDQLAAEMAARRAAIHPPSALNHVGGSSARPTGRRYVEMFGDAALSADGWTNPNEFLAALHAGLADPRLRMLPGGPRMQASIAGSYSDPLGGFSVPSQFFGQWLDESLEDEIVRPRAEIRPMTSKTASAVGFDGASHTSNLYGGFTGQWVQETGEITEETPQLQLLTLNAHKLAILTQVSNELAADGVGYDAQLSRAIVKAIGFYLDLAFLTGVGVGQPEGIVGSAATIVVSKETGQSADTVNYENVKKMFARLHPASFGNSVWVCNSTTIPQLLSLSQVVGTGGSVVPVLNESNGKFTMLTRPVIFTEKTPKLGDKGDILLADFSQYIVGMRQDMSLDKSAHLGFAKNTSHYRGLLRADGRSKLRTPITPVNGDSLSPFIVLAERA
jgi:HK97 family phage major capsid protein